MKVLIVLLVILPVAYALGTVQSAAVRGRLMCNGVPSVNTKVKLYDHDTFPDLDDKMDEGVSDSEGRFVLSGKEAEFTTIDPKLNVYHTCNYKPLLQRCFKKISIGIPKDYVTQGEKPQRVFDAGTINLAGKFGDESTDCIN